MSHRLVGAGAFAVATMFLSTAEAGQLNVVGTGDGLELLRAIAVEFAARHPNVRISLPASIGSGGGIVAVNSDTERLGRIARPLTAAERASGLIYVPIARIPSAIFTHPSAKVADINYDHLRKIFTGDARSWTEFGGADLNIKVVRREEADSTLQILRKTMPGWSDLIFTPRSKTAVTTQDAIQTARDVVGAIGFGPYSRLLEFETTVLKIDGKFPTDTSYPSAVELALIHKRDRLDEDAKAFINFCLSDAAAKIIRMYGGLPIRD